ncbi:hypothetical protein FIBSPDRAFT_945431 [Athelia psychrophila]|uniref:Uncharacterized protein n=1 Tax=Athelia psychrophila TaxID=1759441 RepID=A0A166TRY5_9AGAM|nr:hypothetical protein FIBSPDRAFT_945431 [Fibularhizoctonia sp. CBS 109695]
MPTDIVLAAMSAARDACFARGEPEQERYQENGLGPEALWEFDEDVNIVLNRPHTRGDVQRAMKYSKNDWIRMTFYPICPWCECSDDYCWFNNGVCDLQAPRVTTPDRQPKRTARRSGKPYARPTPAAHS